MSKYTDKQLIQAAQLSYIHFDAEEIQKWRDNHGMEYPTVRDLLLIHLEKNIMSLERHFKSNCIIKKTWR